MIKTAAASLSLAGRTPLRRNVIAAPRFAAAPRYYSNDSPSRPQFATTSPTTGAPMTPINAVPPPNSPPLPPPSSSGIPPVNPAILTSGGIPPMNSSGSAGGGKKKRKGFFRRVGQIFGYGSIAAMASGGYYVYYANHPPEQLAYDASKKTIVILGSGWGSTALLDSIDTTEYNVVVISPYNYFLFTPLLPSVTVGTLNARSITQPTRHVVRYKNREVQVLEAKATKVNAKNKTVTFEGANASEGEIDAQEIKYDYLVYGVGSENQTFGIEGVKKHGLFLKELGDAELIRRRLMDCVEKASLLGQSEEEIDRLLHFVVVGGGPTGVEASSEFRDFVRDDLSKWYPAVSGRVKVTLVEALPNILPSFSSKLVQFTESVFKDNEIQILTKHVVKDVDAKSVTVQNAAGEMINIPTGMLVWAAGNTARPLTRDLQNQYKDIQTNRRGIEVNGFLRMKGADDSIFVIGDAAATDAPPTAQVANQQGRYLAKVFDQLARIDTLSRELQEIKSKGQSTDEARAEVTRVEKKLRRAEYSLKPFLYTSRGAMAYVGNEKAIIQLPFSDMEFSSGGVLTGLAWSSAYWSLLFGIRSRTSVALDWLKVRIFGRDLSV